MVERLWENSCIMKGRVVRLFIWPASSKICQSFYQPVYVTHLTFYWLSVSNQEVRWLAIMFVTLIGLKSSLRVAWKPQSKIWSRVRFWILHWWTRTRSKKKITKKSSWFIQNNLFPLHSIWFWSCWKKWHQKPLPIQMLSTQFNVCDH